MKKLLVFAALILLFAAPFLLPMPIVTSGMTAQYGLGDTMKFDVAAWNVSPFDRTFDKEQATNIVLKIDGTPVATTTTSIEPTVAKFSRIEQTVSYRISDKKAQSVRFDSASGEIELPEGRHTVAVEWMGSSSFRSSISFIKI